MPPLFLVWALPRLSLATGDLAQCPSVDSSSTGIWHGDQVRVWAASEPFSCILRSTGESLCPHGGPVSPEWRDDWTNAYWWESKRRRRKRRQRQGQRIRPGWRPAVSATRSACSAALADECGWCRWSFPPMADANTAHAVSWSDSVCTSPRRPHCSANGSMGHAQLADGEPDRICCFDEWWPWTKQCAPDAEYRSYLTRHGYSPGGWAVFLRRVPCRCYSDDPAAVGGGTATGARDATAKRCQPTSTVAERYAVGSNQVGNGMVVCRPIRCGGTNGAAAVRQWQYGRFGVWHGHVYEVWWFRWPTVDPAAARRRCSARFSVGLAGGDEWPATGRARTCCGTWQWCASTAYCFVTCVHRRTHEARTRPVECRRGDSAASDLTRRTDSGPGSKRRRHDRRNEWDPGGDPDQGAMAEAPRRKCTDPAGWREWSRRASPKRGPGGSQWSSASLDSRGRFPRCEAHWRGGGTRAHEPVRPLPTGLGSNSRPRIQRSGYRRCHAAFGGENPVQGSHGGLLGWRGLGPGLRRSSSGDGPGTQSAAKADSWVPGLCWLGLGEERGLGAPAGDAASLVSGTWCAFLGGVAGSSVRFCSRFSVCWLTTGRRLQGTSLCGLWYCGDLPVRSLAATPPSFPTRYRSRSAATSTDAARTDTAASGPSWGGDTTGGGSPFLRHDYHSGTATSPCPGTRVSGNSWHTRACASGSLGGSWISGPWRGCGLAGAGLSGQQCTPVWCHSGGSAGDPLSGRAWNGAPRVHSAAKREVAAGGKGPSGAAGSPGSAPVPGPAGGERARATSRGAASDFHGGNASTGGATPSGVRSKRAAARPKEKGRKPGILGASRCAICTGPTGAGASTGAAQAPTRCRNGRSAPTARSRIGAGEGIGVCCAPHQAAQRDLGERTCSTPRATDCASTPGRTRGGRRAPTRRQGAHAGQRRHSNADPGSDSGRMLARHKSARQCMWENSGDCSTGPRVHYRQPCSATRQCSDPREPVLDGPTQLQRDHGYARVHRPGRRANAEGRHSPSGPARSHSGLGGLAGGIHGVLGRWQLLECSNPAVGSSVVVPVNGVDGTTGFPSGRGSILRFSRWRGHVPVRTPGQRMAWPYHDRAQPAYHGPACGGAARRRRGAPREARKSGPPPQGRGEGHSVPRCRFHHQFRLDFHAIDDRQWTIVGKADDKRDGRQRLVDRLGPTSPGAFNTRQHLCYFVCVLSVRLCRGLSVPTAAVLVPIRIRPAPRPVHAPASAGKQRLYPSRMTRTGERTRSVMRRARAPTHCCWKVRIQDVVGVIRPTASSQAREALQSLSVRIRESAGSVVVDARRGATECWLQRAQIAGQSQPSARRLCGCASRDLTMAQRTQSWWGSPEDFPWDEEVMIRPCGAFVRTPGSTSSVPRWQLTACHCQADCRRALRDLMHPQDTDNARLVRLRTRTVWFYSTCVQLLLRADHAGPDQLWVHLLLKDIHHVLKTSQQVVAETWWSPTAEGRGLRRTAMSGWTVTMVRQHVTALNQLRVFCTAIQIGKSTEDGFWFGLTPTRALQMLDQWMTLIDSTDWLPSYHSRRRALPPAIWPYSLQRERAVVRGWVYVGHGSTQGNDYVGCTSRKGNHAKAPKGQKASMRWCEHIASAVKTKHCNVSGGIPMYRRLRNVVYGIFDMIWICCFGLVDPEQSAPRVPNSERSFGSVSRAVRTAETLCQSWLRPGLCTPYIYLRSVVSRRTCGYGCIQRRGTGVKQAAGEHRVARTADLRTWLFDTVTGEPWQGGRGPWARQFQQGRLVMDETPLSDMEHAMLLSRLVNQQSQATSVYPVLRRLSEEQVTDLLRFAFSCNPQWELRTWTHLQTATRGRYQKVRVLRLRLQNCRALGLSARDVLAQLAQVTVAANPRCLVRFRAAFGRSVGRTLINEVVWQKKFAGRDRPECACHVLRDLVTPFCEAISWVETSDGMHGWCKWSTLFESHPSVDTRDPVSALGITRAVLTMHGVTKEPVFPFHGKTVLPESLGGVSRVVERGLHRLFRHLPAVDLLARRVDSRQWDLVIGEMAQTWCRSAWSQETTGGGLASVLTRQWFARLWSSSKHIVVSTLDKRPTDMRLACPLLQWHETQREVRAYFDIVCESGESERSAILQQWGASLQGLCEAHMANQYTVPRGMAHTCRCLPKGKSPGEKRRLVVTYANSPARDVMCLTAKAAEGVCELVCDHEHWREESVSSNQDVLTRFAEAQEVLAQTHLPILAVFKFDFVNFFLNVERGAVHEAVCWWVRQARRIHPSRKFVRVRKASFRQLGKELGKQGTGLSADVQLSRAEGDAEWDTVLVSSLPRFVQADTEGLLEFGGSLWQQARGLAIGSPWGGAGCRLWCARQEHRMRHLRAWAHRAGIGTLSRLGHRRLPAPPACMGMRWVDDRWRVVRAATYRQIYQLYVVDIGTYSGVPWHEVQGLAAICGAHWSGPLRPLAQVAQTVLSFVCAGIGQTVEDASNVVGFDVCFGWSDHPLRPLLCGDLSEGVDVGAEPLHLIARLSTKVDALLEDSQVSIGSPFPRFSHRSLDMRAGPERVGSAIQWLVRCADMSWHGGYGDGPPADLDRRWLCADSPPAVAGDVAVPYQSDFVMRTLQASADTMQFAPSVAWLWLRCPLIGLYRELALSGWAFSDVARVLFRARATTRDRVPTSAMRRRLRVLDWFQREARALWSLFGDQERVCPAQGEPMECTRSRA